MFYDAGAPVAQQQGHLLGGGGTEQAEACPQSFPSALGQGLQDERSISF